MKLLNILTNDYRPQFKCGPGIALAASVGGSLAGGVLDNVLGYNQSSHMINRQLDAQCEENQKNRDWQTQQAEIARQFEAGQVLQQNQFQKYLQSQQQVYNLQSMQKQAQLNSPAYMRQQLEKANINPQVYFGNHASFGGSSAVAGGSPSAPAGAKSHMPGSVAGLSPVGIQPPYLQIGQLAQGVSASLKNIAEAKKLGVETDWINDKMKAEIRKLNADSSLADVMTLGQKIDNELNNVKLPYAMEMARTQLRLAISQLELNEANKFTQESVARVNNALEKFHNAQTHLTDLESKKMGMELPYTVQLIKSLINKNSAESKQAEKQTEVLEEERAFKHLEVLFKSATQHDQILNELSKLDASKVRNEVDKYENFVALVKAIKVSKAYEDDNYAKLNAAIEELAKKFGIPIAVAFKIAFK